MGTFRARPAAVGFLVAAAVAVLYVLAACRLPVGIFNDDAANVLLARALRHGSYAFPGGMGAPGEFLPAFPALLALPALLVEPHWNFLRAIPLGFAFLSIFLTWRLSRRFLGVEAAAAATALTALNPILVGLGGLVMPYMPYLALSLFLIDASAESERMRSFVLLTAGAGLAPLLRPHGVLLVLCLALTLWQRHGPKKAGVFLVLAMLPSAVWTAFNHLAATPSYLTVWRANLAEAGQLSVQMRRATELLSDIFSDGLLGLPDIPLAARVAISLAGLGAAGFGAVRILKKREDTRMFILALYTAGMLLMHMTWHWTGSRYAIPFVPFLWIPIVVAFEPVLRGRRAAAVLILLLFRPLELGVLNARRGLDLSLQFEPRTMSWVRENTPPGARFESLMSYSVALLGERACGPQHQVAYGRIWLAQAERNRIDYMHVVLPMPGDQFGPDLPAAYQPAFAAWLLKQKTVTEVYRDFGEGSLVLRVARPVE